VQTGLPPALRNVAIEQKLGQQLPLDLIRMDDRFLRATLRDLEGESIFAAMVTLAHRRRTVVLADGVDTARFGARLTALGCDRATGPVYCPPLGVDDARLLALGRGHPGRVAEQPEFHMQPTS